MCFSPSGASARVLLSLAIVVAGVTPIVAQLPARVLPRQSAPVVAPPLLDDAGLNDVEFVGQRRGWAVGDRGVIWRTDDGGQSWRLFSSGIDCPLRSVCFLTDRVGWVVGGGITPHVGTNYGVVLATNDGGDTWKKRIDHDLPLIYAVRLFDLEHGMAVCESTARFPSGVIQTTDGGKTWQPLPGAAGDGWRVGAFVGRDMGFVAGRLGRMTSIGGGQVMPPINGASGLRAIHDAALQPNGRGWLAGDGGLMLMTDNGGVSWRAPSGELPQPLRDVMDFRAVATRGEHVWLAGTPGSVVWHSPDNGQTWMSEMTGITTPLAALHFTSDQNGWAVGALGIILSTSDGGHTWTPSRGADRRAALLAIHAHESRVSLNLVTKYGGEDAYRTAVTLMSRRDIGPDGDAGRTLDLRLHDAVTRMGGVAGTVDWAFPVAAPELDHHHKELVREWQLLTDNRLREVMLSRLVVQLRTWRPDVLIVDSPPPDDATTKLLGDAIKLAIGQAAEVSPTDEISTLLHLPAWQIKRAYRRLPAGSEGAVAIDAFEFLPRLGTTVAMAAADAVGELEVPLVTDGEREAYGLWPLDELPSELPGKDFFSGLVLTPGGDARRRLSDIVARDLERRQNLANQQRNFSAYARRNLDDERHAAQLIGQTKDIIGAAPPEQAAVQLANLAVEYRRRGQWEHAQTTTFELVERYPDQPVALEALRWLFHFTASDEVSWQRLRSSSAFQRTQIHVDENNVEARVREAIDRAREESHPAAGSDNKTSVIQQTAAEGTLSFGGGADQHAAMLSQWESQAQRLLEVIQRVSPEFYAEPSLQFAVAAFERGRKHPREADAIVRNFLNEAAGSPWHRIAAGEVWITQPATVPPGKVVLCHRTEEAPYLDAALDDLCWQRTLKATLKTDAEHQQSVGPDGPSEAGRGFVQLAYDSGFLYVAAQFPRSAGVAAVPVEQPGRTDDADLTGHDRLSLQFDVDRDYATFYRFDVDQRGWSADACWDNDAWNAQRFIAVQGDSQQWRLEMAIPLTELVPEPPRSGDTWAAGIVRVLPTVGVESWSTPAGTIPHPQGFGLLRFE